jgi:poly-gamma-glutamate capsule biosynthesis protein CapA/YwtB (metallophosphatase superfamily)
MRARTLSRRSFFVAVGSGALALLAACNAPFSPPATTPGPLPGLEPTPSPTSPSLGVVAPEGDPQGAAFARALDAYLAAQPLDLPGALPTGAAPDAGGGRAPQLTISTSPPPVSGMVTQQVTRLYVPVTNWRNPLRNITRTELVGLLGGALPDWGRLGSPVPGPVGRFDYTPGGLPIPPELPAALPAAAGYADYEGLVAALDAAPLAFAIVPLDVVDFRVGALAIDGADPLAGRGDPLAYPLRHDLWLSWDPALGPVVPEAVRAFATSQGYTPDPAAPLGTPINLTVAGDIIFGRTVHSRMVRYNDWSHPLRLVAPRLRDADLTIADLECSLSDNIEQPDDPFTFLFTTNTAAVAGLKLAGIDGVSLANNHTMNFGEPGLSDTIAALTASGIAAFGGGPNLAAARQPGRFTVKGTNFAFLGYDGITADDYGAGPNWGGTCPLRRQLLLDDLTTLRADPTAPLIVPFFHWSAEYVAVPSAEMRELAHLAIDNGAALVIGSHPHWVQGTEWYKGRPILYSLGNFVFDQDWSTETKQGMFAEFVIRERRIARVRLVPVQIEDLNQPRFLDIGEGLEVLQRVYDATDVIKTMA